MSRHRRHCLPEHDSDTCPQCQERLKTGLSLVVHHHQEHTQDGMTAARGPDADVLIISDPLLRQAVTAWMRLAITKEFPDVPNTPMIELAHVPRLPEAGRVGSEPSPTNTLARSNTKQETSNEH